MRNAGPEDLTIAQVIVNDAVWPYTIASGATIPRLGTATIHLSYPWSYGEAYAIRLFTTNAIPFDVEIPVAFETPEADAKTFLSFTLIGLYVGVIPVYLGLFWFPALRQLGRRWMVFLLAVTAGLLVFLGLDTLAEALEQAAAVPGSFQGIGLIGIGAVGTFFLLDAITKRQVATGRSEASQRLSLAYMIAIGIGLHNLGEGLAIGAAFNVGEIALGSFLVVGFIIQNITEGLGIIAPGAARPAWRASSGADGPDRRRAGDPGVVDRWLFALAHSGRALPGDRHRSGVRGGLRDRQADPERYCTGSHAADRFLGYRYRDACSMGNRADDQVTHMSGWLKTGNE